MEIQEVITKAVEGGWKKVCANCQESWAGHVQTRIGSRYCMRTPNMSDTVLDPLFWQALGKAIWWQQTYKNVRGDMRTIGQEDWKEHQHRLISHLQDGGSIESFFEAL